MGFEHFWCTSLVRIFVVNFHAEGFNCLSAFCSHQGLGSGMMLINLSGTCATTKLVQCRDFGIDMCSVARKFEKRPAEVPDLHEVDFKERKKVVQQISQWVNKKGRRAGNDFVPILYDYEVCVFRWPVRSASWYHKDTYILRSCRLCKDLLNAWSVQLVSSEIPFTGL